MREFRLLAHDIDRHLEDAARAKQHLDAERWREQLRPRAMRLFAARTAKLDRSRALLKLVVEELYPDDLFTELVGDLNRVPLRRWPQVLAIAIAPRHSWLQDGLASIARRLHVSLATQRLNERSTGRDTRPSRRRFSGSPRPCQGSPLRSDPIRGSRPGQALGRADAGHLRDGRQAGRTFEKGKNRWRDRTHTQHHGDDRRARARVLRVHHHRRSRTRRSLDYHALCVNKFSGFRDRPGRCTAA